MVGALGFEPRTYWVRASCCFQLSYTPDCSGGLGWIRTTTGLLTMRQIYSLRSSPVLSQPYEALFSNEPNLISTPYRLCGGRGRASPHSRVSSRCAFLGRQTQRLSIVQLLPRWRKATTVFDSLLNIVEILALLATQTNFSPCGRLDRS